MNKRTIIAVIVFFAVALLGISFLTPYWTMSALGGAVSKLHVMDSLGALSISSKVNYDVGNAANYIAIGAFGLLSLYMLVFLVDIKNKLKWVKVTISGLAIVAGVLTLILSLVFINNFNDNLERLLTMSIGIGLVLAIIGGLVGGVVGLLGSFVKSKK